MQYLALGNQTSAPQIYVERTLGLIKPDTTPHYLGRFVSPTLLRGFTELCKQKPVAPFTWMADWLVRNNPNKPKIFDGATGEEAA
uniref:Nucleoside diphosphate kinase homolog 5 n=1 Tax=Hucho hucho TaxID=62062 RepID=A0A4W5LVI8_9TELE